MGIFSNSKRTFSKKPVEEWNRERVLRWLTYLGKEKYADQFKAISGKRLLHLSNEDLKGIVDSKLDADLILDAIQELRRRDGLAPAAAAPGIAPASGNSITAHMKSLPPVNTSMNGNGKPAVASSTATSSEPRTPQSGGRTPTGTPPAMGDSGVAANAEALSNLVRGHNGVNNLFSYMSFLGIQGMGLVEATERSPVVGHIIGTLWELHDLVGNAKGNSGNCLQLDAYGQDILRVFDAEGKRLAFINADALNTILRLTEAGISLIENCSRPGWLLRMANAERSIEEFQAIHNGILEKLRVEKVDTLPNGRQLTYGEYRDASRPLRRCLKQLGSGSLDGGMAAVLQQEAALNEVAQLIGIEKQAIIKDLNYTSSQPELDVLSTQEHSSVSGDYSPISPVGGRSKEYQTIFTQYDKNQSGALEFEELRSVLADLGLLDGIKPTDIESYTLQQFAIADVDQDSRVDFDEFVNFYQSISTTKARRELRSALGPQAEKDLKKIFYSFASFGVRQHVDEMDGAKFSKLCRDCKLLSRNFTTIDVDLIFAKTKVKGQRRINFDGFLSALARAAEKKGQALEDVVGQILSAGGPTVTGTKADYVKFHDDKSTYTGVYSRGGPTNVDPSRELSSLLDRSEADVRGVKRASNSGSDHGLSAVRGTPPSRQPSLGASSDGARSAAPSRRESMTGNVEGGARLRAASGTGEPASQVSLAQAAGRLSSGRLPPVAPRTSLSGTPKAAEAPALEGLPPPPAPASQLTPPSAATNGTVLHTPEAPPAAARADTTPPLPVTGIAAVAATPPAAEVSPRRPSDGSFCAPEAIKRIATDTNDSPNRVPKLAATTVSKEELQGVFSAFASFGSRPASQSPGGGGGAAELDGAKFAKLCRDSQLLEHGFNSTSADIIFSRVKAKGARRITFKDFETALEAIAAEKKLPVAEVQRRIVASGGPKRTGTTPTNHVRLHDDKSTFTGVYKAGGPTVIDSHITLQSLTDRTNTPLLSNRPRMSI